MLRLQDLPSILPPDLATAARSVGPVIGVPIALGDGRAVHMVDGLAYCPRCDAPFEGAGALLEHAGRCTG